MTVGVWGLFFLYRHTCHLCSINFIFISLGWLYEDHMCLFDLSFAPSGSINKPRLINSKLLPGILLCVLQVVVLYILCLLYSTCTVYSTFFNCEILTESRLVAFFKW